MPIAWLVTTLVPANGKLNSSACVAVKRRLYTQLLNTPGETVISGFEEGFFSPLRKLAMTG